MAQRLPESPGVPGSPVLLPESPILLRAKEVELTSLENLPSLETTSPEPLSDDIIVPPRKKQKRRRNSDSGTPPPPSPPPPMTPTDKPVDSLPGDNMTPGETRVGYSLPALSLNPSSVPTSSSPYSSPCSPPITSSSSVTSQLPASSDLLHPSTLDQASSPLIKARVFASRRSRSADDDHRHPPESFASLLRKHVRRYSSLSPLTASTTSPHTTTDKTSKQTRASSAPQTHVRSNGETAPPSRRTETAPPSRRTLGWLPPLPKDIRPVLKTRWKKGSAVRPDKHKKQNNTQNGTASVNGSPDEKMENGRPPTGKTTTTEEPHGAVKKWSVAPLPANEEERLQVLRSYEILDTEMEESFERITSTIAEVCNTPISAISLVDRERQWFKSIYGLDAKETPRDVAFCAHTILLKEDEFLLVNDTHCDSRFRFNPLVTEGPKIRFYAGTPLTDPQGFKLGSLCVISDKPHQLDITQKNVLQTLGRQVVVQLRNRVQRRELEQTVQQMQKVQAEVAEAREMVMVASNNKSRFLANMSHEIRTPINGILGFADLLNENTELNKKQKMYVEHVQSAGAVLLLVINDILDLSKIEAGRFSLYLKPNSLQMLVENALRKAYKQAHRSGSVELLYTLDTALPQKVLVDGDRLTQVLSNLLLPAIRNTHTGHVILHVHPVGELSASVGDVPVLPAEHLSDSTKDLLQDLSREKAREEALSKMKEECEEKKNDRLVAGTKHASANEFEAGLSAAQQNNNNSSSAPKGIDRRVQVAFSISDTGTGISACDAEALFNGFDSKLEQEDGCALALAIAAQLVSVMGGNLGLKPNQADPNKPNFHFSIPLQTLPAASKLEQGPWNKEKCAASHHIIVVGGDEAIATCWQQAWTYAEAQEPKGTLPRAVFHWSVSWEHAEELAAQLKEVTAFMVVDTDGGDVSPLLSNASTPARISRHRTNSTNSQSSPGQSRSHSSYALSLLPSATSHHLLPERVIATYFREKSASTPVFIKLIDLRRSALSGDDAVENVRGPNAFFALEMETPLSFSQEVPKLASILKSRQSGLSEAERIFVGRAKKSSKDADALLSSRCPLRICVAEDNKLNMKLLVKILSNFGYTPSTCKNGKEVVDLVEKGETFDMILMDIHMPEMDGLEATRCLLQYCRDHPEARTPVIVACTASVIEAEQAECYDSGMQDVISKPFTRAMLAACLKKWYMHKSNPSLARPRPPSPSLQLSNSSQNHSPLANSRSLSPSQKQSERHITSHFSSPNGVGDVKGPAAPCPPAAPCLTEEERRLKVLQDYVNLDVPAHSEMLDDITQTLRDYCKTSIASISMVGKNQQIIASQVGLDQKSAPHESSFCRHTIKKSADELLLISDTRKDPIYKEDSKMAKQDGIRFYGGAPLVDPDSGLAIGAICAMNKKPHHLTHAQQSVLKTLSKEVMVNMDLQKQLAQLKVSIQEIHKLTASHKVALEKAYQYDAAKGRFMANMSHEIRTPLNVIVGFAELLSNTALSDTQHTYVQHIKSSGAHLLGIVNDILDMGKLGTGSLKLASEAVNLTEVVEEAMQLAFRSDKANIDVYYSIDPLLPQHIVSDPKRLRQILINLLGNAIKFTHEGWVEVAVARIGANLEEIEFRVADSGIGIPPNKREQLFTPFSQVDISSRRQYGGTGLGLTITKHLSELMGGSVSLVSELEKGSTFLVRLPLRAKVTCHVAVTCPPKRLDKAFAHAWYQHVSRSINNQPDFPEVFFYAVQDWAQVETLLTTVTLDVVLMSRGWNSLSVYAAAKQLLDWCESKQRTPPSCVLLSQNAKVRRDTDSPRSTVPGVEDAKSLFVARMSTPLHFSEAIPKLFALLRERKPFPAASSSGLRQTGTVLDSPMARQLIERRKLVKNDKKLAQQCPLKILVAEDNRLNLKLLVKLLSNFGYSVKTCTNGKQVVDRVVTQGEMFDMILMDVHMPVMSGLEATKCLREQLLSVQPVVVACTASVMDEEQTQFLQQGMDDVISKPIVTAVLKSLIIKWFQQRKAVKLVNSSSPDASPSISPPGTRRAESSGTNASPYISPLVLPRPTPFSPSLSSSPVSVRDRPLSTTASPFASSRGAAPTLTRRRSSPSVSPSVMATSLPVKSPSVAPSSLLPASLHISPPSPPSLPSLEATGSPSIRSRSASSLTSSKETTPTSTVSLSPRTLAASPPATAAEAAALSSSSSSSSSTPASSISSISYSSPSSFLPFSFS
eukprot:g61122.t1